MEGKRQNASLEKASSQEAKLQNTSLQKSSPKNPKKQNTSIGKAASKSSAQINKLKYGIQYAKQVLKLFSNIEGIFDKVQTNQNFRINDILFSKKVDDKIINNLLQEYQTQKTEKNNSNDKNNENIFKDWNFQNQGQNQKRDILVTQLLEYFKDFIQKGKNKSGEVENNKEKKIQIVQGDFDIILGDLDLNANKNIIQYLKSKSGQKIWIQQDYLKVQGILNRNKNDDAKYIFQIKRNPFRQQRQTEEKQKQRNGTLQNWIERNKINKQNKDLNQKENPTFKQIFQNRLLNNNMIENISQIIKLLYACIHLHYKKEQQNLRLDYNEFLRMRSKSQFKYVKKIHSKHPVIVVYYILHSNISKQMFKQKFDFFLPLLRHFFIQNKAILNIIGYTPLNPIEDMQMQIGQLKKLQRQLMEQKDQRKKFERKLMEKQDQIKKFFMEQKDQLKKLQRQLMEQKDQLKKLQRQLMEQKDQRKKIQNQLNLLTEILNELQKEKNV